MAILMLLLVAVIAVLTAYWVLPPLGSFGVQQ
jgi:hypothetical protein